MLRDVPPFDRHDAHEQVFMTHVPAEHGIEAQQEAHNADPLDDVFGSAPSSPILSAQDHVVNQQDAPARQRHGQDHSDIPRLRSIHVTNGYREGIAVSKEKHVQAGFDEGYTVGAEIGMRAGWCLGALHGMWQALNAGAKGNVSTQADTSDNTVSQTKDDVRKLLATAESQLKVESLFGSEYFGPDGIWSYDVSTPESTQGEVTFEQVAEAHPLVAKWQSQVRQLSQKIALQLP